MGPLLICYGIKKCNFPTTINTTLFVPKNKTTQHKTCVLLGITQEEHSFQAKF